MYQYRSRAIAMLATLLAACGSPTASNDATPIADATTTTDSTDSTMSMTDTNLMDRSDVPRPVDVVRPDGDSAVSTEDLHASDRAACMFRAGARVADTLPDLTDARTAITHIIVIVQENRSFDHMFGTLGHGTDGIPTDYSNVGGSGNVVMPFHRNGTCAPDLGHGWAPTHSGWDNGAMDGWARTNGTDSLSYLNDSDHPFYSWLATTFATSDRYFCSVLGPTHPNRAYLYGGTSNGIQESYAGYPTGPFVFDELESSGIQWKAYNASSFEVFSGTLPGNFRNVRPYSEFHPNLMDGTVPPVSFVDLEPNDEHPPGSVHAGENAMHELLTWAFASPMWNHMAIFLTYDEGGGFFDHVPPPSACLASPSETQFDHLGVRVPLIAISPYARGGFVSHSVHSHTSILRFIEAIFDLPAITARDANSDAMLDLFDFSNPSSFPIQSTDVPAASTASCP